MVSAPPERVSAPTVSAPWSTELVATLSVPALIASVPPMVSEALEPSSLSVAFASERISELRDVGRIDGDGVGRRAVDRRRIRGRRRPARRRPVARHLPIAADARPSVRSHVEPSKPCLIYPDVPLITLCCCTTVWTCAPLRQKNRPWANAAGFTHLGRRAPPFPSFAGEEPAPGLDLGVAEGRMGCGRRLPRRESDCTNVAANLERAVPAFRTPSGLSGHLPRFAEKGCWPRGAR